MFVSYKNVRLNLDFVQTYSVAKNKNRYSIFFNFNDGSYKELVSFESLENAEKVCSFIDYNEYKFIGNYEYLLFDANGNAVDEDSTVNIRYNPHIKNIDMFIKVFNIPVVTIGRERTDG